MELALDSELQPLRRPLAVQQLVAGAPGRGELWLGMAPLGPAPSALARALLSVQPLLLQTLARELPIERTPPRGLGWLARRDGSR